MTEKEAQEKLMDYLYGEMDSGDKQAFEKILSNSPELRKELKELRATQSLLRDEPGEIPHRDLLMLQPESPFGHVHQKRKRPFFYLKTAAAIAATILLTLLAFSFIDLKIHQTGQGLLIAFGDQPAAAEEPAEPQLTEEEVYGLIRDMQEENRRVFTNILEETRQEHQQQMENVISSLTAYYDQRRQQDLVLISEGLAQLEEETYYRFLQTEEAFEDLIFALNYSQPEE